MIGYKIDTEVGRLTFVGLRTGDFFIWADEQHLSGDIKLKTTAFSYFNFGNNKLFEWPSGQRVNNHEITSRDILKLNLFPHNVETCED